MGETYHAWEKAQPPGASQMLGVSGVDTQFLHAEYGPSCDV